MNQILLFVESLADEGLLEIGHCLGFVLLFFASHPAAAVPAALLAIGVQKAMQR